VTSSGGSRGGGLSQRRGYVLALLTIIHTLNFLDRSVVNVLLDPIKADLKLSDTELGFVAGFGFALLYTVLGLPFARLADVTSRRNVVAFGVALWSVATALGGMAQSGVQLVLARTGVGVGEAAGAAPSQAILSDLYNRAERPRALSIMNMGAPVGIFLGIFLGGWIAQYFGWRMALFVAGIPGLIVAMLLLRTPEAQRGQADPVGTDIDVVPLGRTIAYLVGQRSYLCCIFGSFFAGFGLNAMFVWSPALFGRIHGWTTGEIGAQVGIVLGASGALGVYAGGAIVTRFGGVDDRWKTIVPAIACAAATPVLLTMALVNSDVIALICLGLGSFLSQSIYGPVFSVYQTVAKVSMRSFATAIHHLFGTLGGLGLGALLVGMLSDRLTASYGVEALRYAIIPPLACFVPAAVLYLLAARFIRADAERATS